MKSRTVRNLRTGERSYRNTVRIVDEPSAPDSDDSTKQLRQLLLDLAENPTLLMCGFAYCQKIRIEHNGEAWVLDAEAEEHVAEQQ